MFLLQFSIAHYLLFSNYEIKLKDDEDSINFIYFSYFIQHI